MGRGNTVKSTIIASIGTNSLTDPEMEEVVGFNLRSKRVKRT